MQNIIRKNKSFKNIIVGFSLVLGSLIFTQIGWAQDSAPSSSGGAYGIKVIPVLGGTFFNLSGLTDKNAAVPAGSTSMHSGLLLGALVDYQLGWLNSSIESGLVYMETGSKLSFLFLAVDTTIGYLTIPVSWKAPLTTVNGTKIYSKLGLIPALKMSAKVKGNWDESASTDINSEINSFDLMAQGGIGGAYPVSPGMDVIMDLTYVRGFTKVVKNGGDGNNAGFILGLGLSIEM